MEPTTYDDNVALEVRAVLIHQKAVKNFLQQFTLKRSEYNRVSSDKEELLTFNERVREQIFTHILKGESTSVRDLYFWEGYELKLYYSELDRNDEAINKAAIKRINAEYRARRATQDRSNAAT